MHPKKTFYLLIVFCLLGIKSFAQDYFANFSKLFSDGDTAGQRLLLGKWEKENTKDAELYVAYYNYYVQKSKSTSRAITKEYKEGAFAITDSLGNNAGYLSEQIVYAPTVLSIAFKYIDKGISLYPKRLDLRFGKIYMLGETEQFEQFTNEIKQTIDYAQTINNSWQWSNGKDLDSPVAFFLSAMHDYMLTVYNANDDDLLPYMLTIAEEVLKYYPNHVQSLSDAGIACILTDQSQKALPYLLKAEKIDHTDVVVLNNIAEAYCRLGDKTKAIAYYDKMIQYGSSQEADYAKEKKSKL